MSEKIIEQILEMHPPTGGQAGWNTLIHSKRTSCQS
jgi:hypothetical protein